MAFRRARVLVGASVLTVAMGVGLVGPASATSITPIKPLAPTTARPVKAPAAAPTTGRVPFRGWSAARIKNRAVADARAAKSVHVKGSGVGQNEKYSWDGIFTQTTGKLRLTSSRQGTVDIIRVGDRLFVSADQKMWVTWGATADQGAVLAGKWVELLGNSANAQQVRAVVDLKSWIGLLSGTKPTKRVAGKRIGGRSTLGLYEPGAAGVVLYVTPVSKTFPVAAESNDRTTTVYYSDWNRAFHVTPPPVIDRIPI